MIIKRLFLFIAPMIIFVCSTSHALAATYYVSPLGNDNNAGTTNSVPWQNISKVNGRTFNSGDSILFQAGETWEGTTLTVSSSSITIGRYGDGANPVINTPAKQSIIIKNKNNVVIDGITSLKSAGEGAIHISDSSYITVKNIEIYSTDPEGSGINLASTTPYATHHITIEKFYIHGTMGWGASGHGVSASSGGLKYITYRDGRFEGIGQSGGEQKHGMYVNSWLADEQNPSRIENVTITNSWNSGLKIVGKTSNLVIKNVSISGSGRNGSGDSGPGIAIGDTRSGEELYNITVENSLIANNVGPAIAILDETAKDPNDTNPTIVYNVKIDHNTFYNNYYSVQVPWKAYGWQVTSNIGFNDKSWPTSNSPLRVQLDTDITKNTFRNNLWYYKNGGNPIRVGTSSSESLDTWQKRAGSPDIGSISIDPILDSSYRPTASTPNSICSGGVGGTHIGAFPCTTTTSPSPSASPSPSGKPGDANGNAKVDGVDYVVWLNNYGKTIAGGPSVGDFNSSGKVDGVDYVLWVNNYGR